MGRPRWLARVVPVGISGILAISGVASSPPVQLQAIPEVATPPLVGFSFNPWAVSFASAKTSWDALDQLLVRLTPDVVRLPVYWSEVEPNPGEFDFSLVDRLVQTIDEYNITATRPARILLVVGARNLGYPEVHLPGWLSESAATNLSRVGSSISYRQYLAASFDHYAQNPILYGWQIENEPLDNVTTDRSGSVAMSSSVVQSEMKILRAIDSVHPAVVTTYTSSHVNLDKQGASPFAWFYNLLGGAKPAGHPSRALALGDALGLDIYVVTPSTPLDQGSALQRIGWKADAIDYWAQQAHAQGRALWITEMQAGPWKDVSGFTTTDLLMSAELYRDRGASLVLLWGVEDWLHSSKWMRAGLHAIEILRATSDPPPCRPAVGHPC